MSEKNTFDIEKIRADFPCLNQKSGTKQLIYFDNAATSQKPNCVIETEANFYAAKNANIHRGLYKLSASATLAFENSRKIVANFINANSPKECIFTRGATEAINLVAASFGRKNLSAGDEILLTEMEHHANIVPWQILAEETGAKIVVAPILKNGELDVCEWKNRLSKRTKIAAFTHTSNALGIKNDVPELTKFAKKFGATVLVDAAQGIAHTKIDVKEIGCDFLAFSGHKIFAPTGIGVLFGNAEILEKMPPYQSGGDMIEKVDFAGTTFRGIPEKFEAGTPNICGAITLGNALEYFEKIRPEAEIHEENLLKYATEKLCEIPSLKIFGNVKNKAPVISFLLENIHQSDLGTLLDTFGIAVRVGHHCAMPLMKALGIAGTVRASFAFYNTFSEIDAFADALVRIKKMF